MRALKTREVATGALAAAVLLTAPMTLGAQESSASWLAWSGCWTEVGAPVDGPMTCIVPDAGGVQILTVTGEGVVERQSLRADGAERPVSGDECTGVQAAEASADGARIYTRSTLSCDGGLERTTRGLMAMVSPDEWIDVRSLAAADGSVSWVKRYRAAPSYRVAAVGVPELEAATGGRARAVEAARISASRAPSVDAIIEATRQTDPEAVRAWIAEQGAPVRLDAEALVRMADAGVGEEVIDVVVAVSYPERFALDRQPERRADEDAYGSRYDRQRAGWYGGGFWSPYRYDPFYYSPFYYGRGGYGYNSFGYGGYYGSPTVVVVRPAGSDGEVGRAVKGRGYTRGGSASDGSNVRPARPSSAQGGGYIRSGGGSSATSSPASTSSKGKAKPKSKGGG